MPIDPNPASPEFTPSESPPETPQEVPDTSPTPQGDAPLVDG